MCLLGAGIRESLVPFRIGDLKLAFKSEDIAAFTSGDSRDIHFPSLEKEGGFLIGKTNLLVSMG